MRSRSSSWFSQNVRRCLLATVLCAAATLPALPAQASEVGTTRKFGLGGMIGAPTGLSMKLFFNPSHALDFGLGLGFFGNYGGSVHVDYLFHFMLTRKPAFDLPLYVGVGGEVEAFFLGGGHHGYWGGSSSTGGIGVAVRVPVGVAFQLNRVPIDIFIELVPGIGFVPGHDFVTGDATIGAGFYMEGAAGCRYYF